LARQRWALATGEQIPPVSSTNVPKSVRTPWPKAVPVLLHQADIGIARTLPSYGEQTEAHEVEAVLLDAIKQARAFIYIENQYFTSHRIGQALIDRLGEPDGPELVIVLPREKDGWLERVTMDVLRARLIRRLRAADVFDHLRIYYPKVRGLAPQMVSVHSKLVIADNIHLNVGSANLSNRSMGLDSELNLSLLGSDEAGRQAIDQIRHRLLAEHLGTREDRVADTETDHGSLIATIEALNRTDAMSPESRRWLEPLARTAGDHAG
jgi:phospholipase D1/2